jgi:purine-binding chemotaxis protein CheW
MTTIDTTADTLELCTFWVGEQVYGLPVTEVQEVLGPQPLTPVPLAEPSVAGLTNLRGQLVTVLDLHLRLGTPAEESGPPAARPQLVVRTAHGNVSVLVDRVGDVIEVDVDRVDEAPPTITGPAADIVHSAVDLGPDGLLLVLSGAELTRPRARA